MNKAEFDRVPFSREYWDRNGGDPAHRPFWDAVPSHDGLVERCFVSSDCFSDWGRWKREADRARQAVSMKYNRWKGSWSISGAGLPLSAEPHFIRESGEVFINILCPDETSFHATIAEAKKEDRSTIGGLFKAMAAENTASHPYSWCCDYDKPLTVSESL